MKIKIRYTLILLGLFLSISGYAQCFTGISFTGGHIVGKKTDGALWCWGVGNSGQLGNGTDSDEYMPILLSSTSIWQIYKAGYMNTYAIKTNGTLWGTGSNLYGSLGIGSTTNHLSVLTQIGTGTNWKDIFPADYFTVGIKTDNTLWAWGLNAYNQVGDGSGVQRNSPVQIGGTADWKTVASSRCSSSVAIKTNGTLWGWGSNSCYVFGDSGVSAYTVPQQLTLSTDTDWDKVTGGGGFFLALKTNGALWAWGDGGLGQTGHDPMQGFSLYELNQIPGMWKAIGAGFQFSMGIKTDGTLWQWGKNDIAETSQDQTDYSFVPLQIGTATNWESISCGPYTVAALRTDGSLWAWGNNDYGQLGNGTTTPVAEPSQVPIAGCSLGTETFTTATRFTISPSPAQQELLVTYQGAQTVDAIVIYDISGKEVYRIAAMGNAAFSSSFSIASLSGGSYVMALINGGKTVLSKQFVKE